MLASMLACRGEVLATAGNLNNEIGVPKTLLSLSAEHDYAVIEMGAAKAGDIEYLCQFAKPDVALVTNAAPAHLEGFGDIDTVARTKGAIFSGLGEQGVAVINSDDHYAQLWQQMAGKARVVRFSLQDKNADVFASEIKIDERGVQQFQLHCFGESIAIELPLLGRHNIANALAAAAAAVAVGATLANVRDGLAALQPVAGRLFSHRTKAGGLLIDDTYNANPVAVKAAIDVIAAMPKPAYLLLGNMAELGCEAEAFHAEVGRYAAAAGLAGVLAVGPNAKAVCDGFGNEQALYFDSVATMIAYSREHLLDQVLLVKGSRSAAMERVVSALLNSADVVINNGGQE
jgi:UDP-N-acetylmuramoyl-tripeptide--D-alanyl-D-alanine ligase